MPSSLIKLLKYFLILAVIVIICYIAYIKRKPEPTGFIFDAQTNTYQQKTIGNQR